MTPDQLRALLTSNGVSFNNSMNYSQLLYLAKVNGLTATKTTDTVVQATTGPRGATGNTGATGATGAAGPAGSTGPAGATGPAGPAGSDGSEGPAGPQGAQGTTGPAGTDGTDGTDGSTGATGPAGAQGPVGSAGPAGEEGPAGPQGPAGAQGPAGPAGGDGSDGAQGPQGPAGADGSDGGTGPAGPQGPAGADGSDGAAGAQGPAGPAGPQGEEGFEGPAGPQGPAGAQGEEGPEGPAGPAGPQGPAGPAGADGADGSDGAAGAQGPAGPQGPAGADGADGADGAQGPAGPQGPSGSTIDISALTANTQIADADLLLLDDGANGTNRKITFTDVKEWIRGDGVITADSNGNPNVEGGVNELKVRDSRYEGELLPDSVGDKQVRFDFTSALRAYTPSAYWSGGMTLKGWGGSYRAWQLLSSATSEGTSAVDTEPLYFRSGEDSVWGAMREVLTFPVGASGSTPNADGAANQILQTDGAGTLSWVDLPAGGGGTPSGVAGAIQFSDGAAFASDDANLHYDNANNRLGVGTNAPQHTLHVDGVGDFPMRIQGDQGNFRVNEFGHLHIQNDNSNPIDGATIDSPLWQVGQRDGGQFDIAFGALSTQLVSYNDQLLVLQRAGNSATGAKQIGFLGATPVARQSVVDPLAAGFNPPAATANELALQTSLDSIIAALQALGLFA
jgi:hypothetical protein